MTIQTSDLTFGIECEFKTNLERDQIVALLVAAGVPAFNANRMDALPNAWKVTTDGSVHPTVQYAFGWELVSPILKGADGLRQAEAVFSVLSQHANVDTECGLHLHVGLAANGANFTLDQVKNIVKRYGKYERTIDSLVAPSRRADNNRFCRSLLTPHFPAGVSWGTLTDEQEQEVVRRFFRSVGRQRTMEGLARTVSHDRYCKVNLHAFWRHGTVEFRQHGGTVEPTKILAWTKLLLALVAQSVNQRSIGVKIQGTTAPERLNKFAKFIKLPEPTRRFLAARQEAFAARVV